MLIPKHLKLDSRSTGFPTSGVYVISGIVIARSDPKVTLHEVPEELPGVDEDGGNGKRITPLCNGRGYFFCKNFFFRYYLLLTIV